MAESADPLEAKLSGGRGDNPALAGKKPTSDHAQITDHLKPQDSHTEKYLQKIKPHVQTTVKQNSHNIAANDGNKTARPQ